MNTHSGPQDSRKKTRRPSTIKAKEGSFPKPAAPVKKITETYLSNAGAYYLQRYAASTAQFRTVMTRKIDRSCRAHPDQDRETCIAMLDRLVDKFAGLGYLNDDGYARSMVTSLCQRGLSYRSILMKLQNRGLSSGQIDAALNQYHYDHQITSMETERKAALKLARKKKVGPYAPDGNWDRNKALAAFARAGFSFELARTVLDMTAEEIEMGF